MARALVWLLPLICLAAGCGVDADSRSPVRGVVRYRGQLLTCGTVVFAPDLDRGTPNEMAVGQIKTDGSFHLQCDTGLGIAPGWYRITVVAGFNPNSNLRLALPEKYRDPQRSGLEREIKSGRENVVELKLE